MCKSFVLTLGLTFFVMSGLNARNSKNLTLVKEGKFETKYKGELKTVSIASFRISGLITNEEFIEFVDYVKTHKDFELKVIDWVKYYELKSIDLA